MNTIILITALITNQGFCLNGNCNNDLPPQAVTDITYQSTKIKQTDILYVKLMATSLRNTPIEKRDEMMNYALTSSDSRLKAAACGVARDYGFKYTEDLLNNIADTDLLVQQLSRYTLIHLAHQVNGKDKLFDFGPMVSDNGVQVTASQTMWKLWIASLTPEQKAAKGDAGKNTLGKGSTSAPILTKEK